LINSSLDGIEIFSRLLKENDAMSFSKPYEPMEADDNIE